MIRSLAMIAVAGAIISLICLASAASLGFQTVKNGWPFPGEWTFDGDNHDGNYSDFRKIDWNSPVTTKDMHWTGDDEISINVPAEVTITQADAPKMTITGPTDAVNKIVVEGGDINFEGREHVRVSVRGLNVNLRGMDNFRRVKIEIATPNTHSVNAGVASKLHLVGLKADDMELNINTASDADGTVDANRLKLRVHTGADARLEGRADDLDIEVHTGGDAKLDRLAAKTVHVEAHTGGSAMVSASESIDAEAHTGGDIVVRGHPPKVNSNLHTGGNLRFEEGPAAEPPKATNSTNAPSVSPSPSPSPSPPKKVKT